MVLPKLYILTVTWSTLVKVFAQFFSMHGWFDKLISDYIPSSPLPSFIIQLIAVRKIPWAKANLNHTAQALMISGGILKSILYDLLFLVIGFSQVLTCEFMISIWHHINGRNRWCQRSRREMVMTFIIDQIITFSLASKKIF